MKRAFIRTLWGDYKPKDPSEKGWIAPEYRRRKIDIEIDNVLKNKYTIPFVTYVFGENNVSFLKEKGITDIVCVNPKPTVWDLQKQFWRHKLDILYYAMYVDGYDEIIYLDWDCILTKPVPEDIWEILHRKYPLQANLQFYRNKRCLWRGDTDIRKVSNGGFLYIGDKNITIQLISAWENLSPEKLKFWDESAISKLTDDMIGGWKGIDAYWENFEPEVCNLKKKSAFSQDRVLSKDACFLHFIQSANNREGTIYEDGLT